MAICVICLFLTVSWVGLGSVIVAFPFHSHLRFQYSRLYLYSNTLFIINHSNHNEHEMVYPVLINIRLHLPVQSSLTFGRWVSGSKEIA